MLEAETETNEEEIADEAYHDDKRSRVKDYKMPRRKTTRRRRIPSKIMDYYRQVKILVQNLTKISAKIVLFLPWWHLKQDWKGYFHSYDTDPAFDADAKQW